MSTKNKPVPYIDAQTTSDSPAPVTRKVRFNPYTGGILSNANDKPSFGKYTMEIRSGTKFVAKMVQFKPSAGRSISMQIPIPDVKLYVKNPNYDIMDSIVYLALDQDALAGVDNGGNFDQTTQQATGADYYVSFSPAKSSPVVKNTITLELYDEIVRLFEKYTVYQLLFLMTGKSYSEVTDSNTLIGLVQDNFHNLNLYAEAGFNNDSDSTADGYFIRNKLVTRFTFDRSYLDNPSLTSMNIRRDNVNIYLDLGCESLQSVTFNLYAGPDTTFDYSSTAEFIATYTISLGNRKNPTVTIPVANIKIPGFNTLTAFQSNAVLERLVFGRKCIAVKITKVRVAAGTDVFESQFQQRFSINPAVATTKTSTFTTNISAPLLSTNTNLTNPPYLLDLARSRRKFYLKIVQPRTVGAEKDNPRGLSGFLVRYINNANTATNAIRFFSFNSDLVNLMNGEGILTSGTNTIEYYYEISDYFQLGGVRESSFKLSIPYSNLIQIYLVDNYYNVSTVPLKLFPIPVYTTTNYFRTGGDAFAIGANFVLEAINGFLKNNPRHTLNFTVHSTPITPGQSNPPPNAKWTPVNGGAVYTYYYQHFLGYILKPGDNTGVQILDKDNTALTGVSLLTLFNKAGKGQGYWIRLTLVDTYRYSTTQQKPYLGTVLAIYKKTK